MTLTIETTHSIDKNKWNEFLNENPSTTIYQLHQWSNIYKETYDSTPLFILVKDDSKIVGQLLAFIHEKYFWAETNNFIQSLGLTSFLGKTIMWWYGPVIHDESNSEQILEKILKEIDRIAKINNIFMIKGTSSPFSSLLPKQPFQDCNYTLKPWSTYIIDLQKYENMFDDLNKKTRYDIRKAENENLEFYNSTNESNFKNYLQLKAENTKNDFVENIITKKFISTHLKYLYLNGNENLFLAKKNGIPVSGILNVSSHGKIIQHGVANSKNKNSQSGTFLTWNAIQWAKKNNYNYYDMGGANPNPISEKEKAIDFYKSKWLGEKIPYTQYVKIVNKTKYRIACLLTNQKKVKSKLKTFLKISDTYN